MEENSGQPGNEDMVKESRKRTHDDESGSQSKTTYGRRKNQISKDSMYMMTALWMEQSPWNFKYQARKQLNIVGDENKLNVVGAVFVLPNDRVLSVGCSRRNNSTAASQTDKEGIVHGAVQALIKYPDRVKDCKVYLSRKPCANCVKFLVQAAVEKVFYLPLRPEICEDNKSVDALFQVSTVSRSFFVPDITEGDVEELENKSKKPYGMRMENLGIQGKNYAGEEWDKWKGNIKEKLDWEEYGDQEISDQVDKEMQTMFEWFGMATFATGRKDVMDWEPKNPTSKKPSKEVNEKPEVKSHLSRLAQMLSNRTDDPNRNVGCVITIGEEIVSIGWNGFPSKALYGNHPRGSKDDKARDKYPHVIHAEQNALLCRNRRDLTSGIAYVNKIPCYECMPMLYQLGVKTMVLPGVLEAEEEKPVSETYFYKLLDKKEIDVFTQVE